LATSNGLGIFGRSADFPRFPQMELQFRLQSDPQIRSQSDCRSVSGRIGGRPTARACCSESRTRRPSDCDCIAWYSAANYVERVGDRWMVCRFDGRTAGGSAVHDEMNGHPNGREVANGCPVGHPVGQMNAHPVGHPVGHANGLVDRQAAQQAERQRFEPHALLHRLGATRLRREGGRSVDGPQDLGRIPRVASRSTCRILPKSLPKRLPKSLPR
jgi:hypothetical protein